MNERIRELWTKAAESTAAFPSGQNNSWETQVNFMDKFAELIVKECAGVCEEHKEMYAMLAATQIEFAAMTTAATTCAKDIKEHFGVK